CCGVKRRNLVERPGEDYLSETARTPPARRDYGAMKISPQWLRDFVDLQVNYHQLADDLTLAGIAVESISGEGDGTAFDMDMTTNRPDAMNHFGVARECSAIYNLPLKPIAPKLPAAKGSAEFHIQ